jgi:hypothetical protein
MNCSVEECLSSVVVIALVTAVATDYISLPPTIVSNPITTVLLVLFAIGSFMKFPVLGIALFLLTAIVLFKRNTNSARAVATYGVETIRRQAHEHAEPSSTQASGPREYNQFQETDAQNPMHSTLATFQEGFEPAPYGDAVLGESVEGAYPIGAARSSASSDALEYVYRPDSNTGSNSFERFGPEMDEKTRAFAY